MVEGRYYHGESSRLTRLAEAATTDRVRQALLQQAQKNESIAFELDLIALRDEVDKLMP